MVEMLDELSADCFRAWLNRSGEPGRVIGYYTGMLVDAREPRRHHSAPRSFEINKLARAVWLAYEHGLVALTQRRLGVGQYLYLATTLTSKGK
jgi:hypothetical protein